MSVRSSIATRPVCVARCARTWPQNRVARYSSSMTSGHADGQRRQQRERLGVAVEERQRGEQPVVGPQQEVADRALARPQQVGVGEHTAFGRAVVPEVKIISATSSDATAGASVSGAQAARSS